MHVNDRAACKQNILFSLNRTGSSNIKESLEQIQNTHKFSQKIMAAEIPIRRINETVKSCDSIDLSIQGLGKFRKEQNVAVPEPTGSRVCKTTEHDSEDSRSPNWYCQIVVSYHRLAFGTYIYILIVSEISMESYLNPV